LIDFHPASLNQGFHHPGGGSEFGELENGQQGFVCWRVSAGWRGSVMRKSIALSALPEALHGSPATSSNLITQLEFLIGKPVAALNSAIYVPGQFQKPRPAWYLVELFLTFQPAPTHSQIFSHPSKH